MISFAVNEVAHWVDGRVVNTSELGPLLEEIRVSRPGSLAGSQPLDLVFFFSRAFEHELPSVRAGILITGELFVKPLKLAKLSFWNQTAVIACADPYLALALLSEKFAAVLSSVAHMGAVQNSNPPEVHPTAVVDPTAELGERVKVGPYCVIEAKARIGAGTTLYAGCTVGPGCVIGENCVLFPRVTLYEWTEIGNRVRLHSGCVLGSDGFGYAPKKQGEKVSGHQKIFHLGKVVVGDDVEIGANSTVDRGTIGKTQICNQVKLDNLVHIGHNAHLEEGAVVCGGTCLAGNSSLGKFTYIGGLTGITNHVHVGDGASVGSLSLVTKDVPAGGTAVGSPQREYHEHFRAHALLSRMLSKRRSH